MADDPQWLTSKPFQIFVLVGHYVSFEFASDEEVLGCQSRRELIRSIEDSTSWYDFCAAPYIDADTDVDVLAVVRISPKNKGIQNQD